MPLDTLFAEPQRRISVNVASLSEPLFRTGVYIGLNGDGPDLDNWLRALDSPAPYSEEAFEWKIASLLPCPRSFFNLVYEDDGLLRIIFATRSDSLPAATCMEPWRAYCECCFSQMSSQYQRTLLPGHFGTEKHAFQNRWYGDKHLCILCFDSNLSAIRSISRMHGKQPQSRPRRHLLGANTRLPVKHKAKDLAR